ncbi:MAG: SprT family zinc-dependent metalloprotease [Planctomycetes bacterium]|nr:SprT family zinc-dependent metalloprotease [Planctomycetota bacterium]
MYQTRENWLTEMTNAMKELFAVHSYSIPDNIRFSCGWPKGSRGGNKTIGQCWSSICSKDGHFEIFISPELDDPCRVADVLLHELCHAVVGVDQGHNQTFKNCATSLGLTGKMTATTASEELQNQLSCLCLSIGPYPHAQLTPKQKKQGTRMCKIICQNCGYLARTSQKWIELGLPTCYCGELMVEGV